MTIVQNFALFCINRMALVQESSVVISVVKNTKWRCVQNFETEDAEFVQKRVTPLLIAQRKIPSLTNRRETVRVGATKGGVDRR